MKETQMLATLLSEGSSFGARNAAADLLLERLSNGFENRDALDLLDGMLNGSEKVAMEESLREKLQTIALKVDTLILNNPRRYEHRAVQWLRPRTPIRNEHSGSWERESAKRWREKQKR